MEWQNFSDSPCNLCPRNCRADRKNGEKGYCFSGEKPVVARAALHMWEEPCISGAKGSGAVFFSGCGLRCAYCQNFEIAASRRGKEITVEHLAWYFSTSLFNTASGYILPLAFCIPNFCNTTSSTNGFGMFHSPFSLESNAS